MIRRLVPAAIFAALLLAAWQQEAPPFSARLEVTVEPRLPARVYLFKNNEPFRLQPVQATLPVRSDLFYRDRLWLENPDPDVLEAICNDEYHYFLLKGRASFHLPAGKYRMEAYRGFFYKPAVVEFELKPDQTGRVTLPLEAWAQPEQWISADDHIHLTRTRREDPVFLNWMAAEDLNVGNFLALHRQMDAAPQHAFGRGGEFRRAGYAIRPGQETRNQSFGHIIFLGGEKLIRPMSTGGDLANSPEDYPFHTLLFDQARKAGALTGYAHFRQRPMKTTLYMDLALGKLDFIELFQFGELTTEPWYELLNAGFRVTGVAGSDFPVYVQRLKPYPRWVPLLGPERAMVNVRDARDREDPYGAWARGVRDGQVVVSNGPLVELRIEGGEARAAASFWRPIEILEIVRNGVVVASAPGGGLPRASVSIKVPAGEAAWYAARTRAATGKGEPALQAHTNPLYPHGPVRIPSARKAIADTWQDEIGRYRQAPLVFPSAAARAEFFESAERGLAELRRQ